ncbi:MAG: hypothetical protein EON85_08215 [Brevundimonas sp.]|nr:MAG: hypothetical protein EON85_08215 [Brevundimonas sp.]
MTGAWGWLIRSALLLLALVAPAAGYQLRAGQTGNAETAIDGLLSGFVVTALALIAFAASFRTSMPGRAVRLVFAVIGVVLIWALGLVIANI